MTEQAKIKFQNGDNVQHIHTGLGAGRGRHFGEAAGGQAVCKMAPEADSPSPVFQSKSESSHHTTRTGEEHLLLCCN